MPLPTPPRPRSTFLGVLLLWAVFYASFTLFVPPLLDDADSVHAEVAREMLFRHDFITLHANGIRYLEKAPLLYWSMAACMRVSQLLGHPEPRALAVAARIPLSLTVLALALLAESFGRRVFRSARSGLYAALILLSSFGVFLFTRITIPDAMVCLFTTLALYAFYLTEELEHTTSNNIADTHRWVAHPFASFVKGRGDFLTPRYATRVYCLIFAAACALNVLTKGLIGVVFPVVIVLLYLLLTRGLRRTFLRLRGLHLVSALAVFLVIAAPWHILAGMANPTQGHPAAFHFAFEPASFVGHWQVPLPTDGNVRGWFWFYFMNEHLLRYLNLRVPHDYDTAPLWLFWGLCLIWLMPWSAFFFKAFGHGLPLRSGKWFRQFRRHDLPLAQRGQLLLVVWIAFVLLFFSLSTRQEYYVLPALPAIALLIAGWLACRATAKPEAELHRHAVYRCNAAAVLFGALFAAAALFFLVRTHSAPPASDLASLLTQNPSDYALSMGHFLDLTGPALALFRLPLTIAVISLFVFPLAALLLRKYSQPHAANLTLAAGAFGFLLAAHLGLQTFAPVLTSAQLAQAIAPQILPGDLLCIHGEYESGSTLGFYLQRPGAYGAPSSDSQDIHILEGRSSNLWYGSFFPDSPRIFETPESIAKKWDGPQRIFLWQSLTDPPNQLPKLSGPVYILVKSGGKEIVSNQPNR